MSENNTKRLLRRLVTFHLKFSDNVLGMQVDFQGEPYTISRVYITDTLGITTGRTAVIVNNTRTILVPFEMPDGSIKMSSFCTSNTLAPFDSTCIRNWLLTIDVTVAKDANPSPGQLGFDQFGIFLSTKVKLPSDSYEPPYTPTSLPVKYVEDSLSTTLDKLTI